MTLTSEIITDAFRQSNVLALGVAPTTAQADEALRYLNRLVKSVFGSEVSELLQPIPIGRNNISAPSGYPWWNTVPDSDWYIPKQARVMLNITQTLTLPLNPAPDDGSRFGVIDMSNDLSTYPVTLRGNGRLIENATTITLNTNGYNAEWMYRADLGNWMKYAPLVSSDAFPFPIEFDFFFIIQLAMALNPAYGTTADQQTLLNYQRARGQLRARYAQHIQVNSELGLLRLTRTAADRDRWGNIYNLYDPTDMFNRGWPW